MVTHGARVYIYDLSHSDTDLNGATGTILSEHNVPGSSSQGYCVQLDHTKETVNVRRRNLLPVPKQTIAATPTCMPVLNHGSNPDRMDIFSDHSSDSDSPEVIRVVSDCDSRNFSRFHEAVRPHGNQLHGLTMQQTLVVLVAARCAIFF